MLAMEEKSHNVEFTQHSKLKMYLLASGKYPKSDPSSFTKAF